MHVPPRVIDMDIGIQTDDLLGPLGYGDGKEVSPAIMEQIQSETRRCLDVMRGQAIYFVADVRRLEREATIEVGDATVSDAKLASAINGACSLAVAICTVGPEIDTIIGDYFERGDYLNGMIADIVGNRAAEDLANRGATLICTEAKENGLSIASHLSPGYGTWDVSGQRVVFSLLDPTPIGVSLNDHCMMQPKKSVSFVLALAKGETGHKDRPPCHGCGFPNCSYRRK